MQTNMKNTIENKNNLSQDTEGINSFLTESEISVIIDRLSFVKKHLKSGSWLDLCCGQGLCTSLIKFKNNIIYYGLDLIKSNCMITREVRKANVVCGDAENLPFKNQSFNIVTLLAGIYYLNREKIIPEINRVLKKEGVFIFDTSNCQLPGFHKARETKEYFSSENWIIYLNQLGFKVKCYESNQKFNASHYENIFYYFKKTIKFFLFKIPFFKKYFHNLSIKYKSKFYFDMNYLDRSLKNNNSWIVLNKKNVSNSLVVYFICKKV